MTDYSNRCYNTIAYNPRSKERPDLSESLADKSGKNGLVKSAWFPSATHVENKYHYSVFPDGPMATSFEKYVHNIFRPGNKIPKLPGAAGNLISAQSMLRVQDLLGSAALNESFDEDILRGPLEKMFSEQGLTGIEDYSVYSPYYPTKSASLTCTSTILSPFQIKDNCTSYRRKANDEWERNNRQMIIDYKGSDAAPLTPYMYAEHPYVRSQDSRIVGSNFVQITSRPKDRFLEKIDRTLAEVRAMPRF
uniref:Uncharacterized protein n=1 Tax=Setaria digitata TaxID=48799 RepID=A0A915PHA0_9BILA